VAGEIVAARAIGPGSFAVAIVDPAIGSIEKYSTRAVR
jgi:hypothetical protein